MQDFMHHNFQDRTPWVNPNIVPTLCALDLMVLRVIPKGTLVNASLF